MEMSRIDKICESIRKKVPYVPDVLVILGSGLGSMAEQVED